MQLIFDVDFVSAALQNLILILTFFWGGVESLGFSVHKSLPSARRDDFLLSFKCGFLRFVSCLIALARTYSTMLKISSKNWQACLIFHLRK